MTLHEIEGGLCQIVVELHDLARSCTEPAVEHHLRQIAHEVSLAVDRVRELMASRA